MVVEEGVHVLEIGGWTCLEIWGAEGVRLFIWSLITLEAFLGGICLVGGLWIWEE